MLQTSAQIVSIQSLPPEMGARFHFLQAGRRSLSLGWLCSSQRRRTSSQILARRHTQTNTHQLYGLVTSVTNKQQTSIRCNHTHNTHWVHLKCTHIKQRQYKQWLEMHHSHTHTKRNNNTRHRQHNSPSQTNYHPPTHRTKTSSYFKST